MKNKKNRNAHFLKITCYIWTGFFCLLHTPTCYAFLPESQSLMESRQLSKHSSISPNEHDTLANAQDAHCQPTTESKIHCLSSADRQKVSETPFSSPSISLLSVSRLNKNKKKKRKKKVLQPDQSQTLIHSQTFRGPSCRGKIQMGIWLSR